MKIHCHTGLVDRIGFIFSYLNKAKKNNEELIVCWRENDHCNGHFLDLFEPIPGLTFTTNADKCDVTGWLHCPGYSAWNVFIWNQLRLRKELKCEVENLRHKLNYKYAAIHVRRTEALRIFGSDLTPDSDFFQFVEKYEKVFLATDNSETQRVYKEKYKDKIFCSSQIDKSYKSNASEVFDPSFVVTRETSLRIAAIDLFTCIYSNHFMGTNHSGYSKFIEQFRNYRIKNHMLI